MLFPMLQPVQRRMRRRRFTTLAEERTSLSQTCEREYFLGTNQLSGRRRSRMWRMWFILHITSEARHSLSSTTYNT